MQSLKLFRRKLLKNKYVVLSILKTKETNHPLTQIRENTQKQQFYSLETTMSVQTYSSGTDNVRLPKNGDTKRNVVKACNGGTTTFPQNNATYLCPQKKPAITDWIPSEKQITEGIQFT